MDQTSHDSDEFLDQHLSAAIDNELNADDCDELLEHLAEKPDMQQAWERHHTINALLRGEQIAAKNHLPWENIHARFSAENASSTRAGVVIDLALFKERYLAKVVGGMALAASVVLGVSLFVAMQNPVQNLQVPLAAEDSGASESTSQLAASEPAPSNPSTAQPSRLPTTTDQPDVYLASDGEVRQSPLPSSEPERQSRAYPTDQPAPSNDLVRFASD